MHGLIPAYGRAMRERLRRGAAGHGRLPKPVNKRRVLASPFLASLTPLLVTALGARQSDFILSASADDAADYGRVRRLAAERLELQS